MLSKPKPQTNVPYSPKEKPGFVTQGRPRNPANSTDPDPLKLFEPKLTKALTTLERQTDDVYKVTGTQQMLFADDDITLHWTTSNRLCLNFV